MAKAWSSREKELIKNSLRNEGRKLFEKYGIRKTTLDDIVRSAGISKGAFYFFYQSKEELFFDILESLERDYKTRIYGNIFLPGVSRRDSFRQFFKNLIDILKEVPLFGSMNPADYEYLMRKLPDKKLTGHIDTDFSELAFLFSPWMDKGWIKKVNLKALSGLMLSLFYFIIHRGDVGEIDFDGTKELLIDMLTDYLVLEE